MFEQAIPVAGLLHIVDNLAHDIHDRALKLWPDMSPKLSLMCRVFSEEGLRERFVEKCLRSGGYPQYVKDFSRTFQQPIEWRWGSLIGTLRWLLELETKMREAWDAEKFGEVVRKGRRHAGAEAFSRTYFTRVARDKQFWCYMHMLFLMQSALDRVAWWAESCPCHPLPYIHGEHRLARAYRERKEWQRLVRKCGHRWRSLFRFCLMKGKHAPDLAAKAVIRKLDESIRMMNTMLLAKCIDEGLTPTQQDEIMEDWNLGVEFLCAGLRAKTGFWLVLPWRLCALGHHIPQEVQQCAAECLSMYDARPDPKEHHRKQHHVEPQLAHQGRHRATCERSSLGGCVACLSEGCH